ncbi:MAG: HAD family hydrolase [Defluviitaleaceae bacterium]|nr:HAD family hydrolase [Defluviitaleaceae bacterium]
MINTVLFDFDGTISTLRSGWEKVMEPLMIELLGKGSEEVVRQYIDESTGIQTILQMEWLSSEVKTRHGHGKDPWEYKAEYNRRLMETVSKRRQSIVDGEAQPEDYLIAGSKELLQVLHERGINLMVASGTDDPDVKAEVAVLGLSKYFSEISGAPLGKKNCPKEGVIRSLLESGIPPKSVAVVGDGKVEIMIGQEYGARTLGLASDEKARMGINLVKEERLKAAGADIIMGDFQDIEGVIRFLLG